MSAGLIFGYLAEIHVRLEKAFKQQQKDNEGEKEEQYPAGTLVLFPEPRTIFPVHPDRHQDENQDEEQGKNDLSRAEHISYFSAKVS